MKNIFYPHFLKLEIAKRDKAIELFKLKDFEKLSRNYIHYLDGVNKSVDLFEASIGDSYKQLDDIMESIPENASSPQTSANMEIVDGVLGSVTWTEYSIASINKCESLAKCWSSDYVHYMTRQPNGKDGKRATELYNKLTK